METMLQTAKDALLNEGTTFAAVSADGRIRTSDKKGIAPIMQIFREEPSFFEGAVVADLVIGKAAALLLAKGKISQLHTRILSEHAKKSLEDNNIPFSYDTLVPHIVNRTGDGMCPMEQTVLEISDVEEAFLALEAKIAILMAQKQAK